MSRSFDQLREWFDGPLLVSGGDAHSLVSRVLTQRGIERRVAVRVPYFEARPMTNSPWEDASGPPAGPCTPGGSRSSPRCNVTCMMALLSHTFRLSMRQLLS
jgi:hypothetical protein